jgi:hypothetical protein
MMTDPQPHLQDRPWTPGPWCEDGGDKSWDPETLEAVDANIHIAAQRERNEDCVTIAWVEGDATALSNAALIALAPEMAEAILHYIEAMDFTGDEEQFGRAVFQEYADKLRAIGAWINADLSDVRQDM